MTEPVTIDLGTISLPDDRILQCSVELRVAIVVDGVRIGDRGAILEDHLSEILQRLISKLGGARAWHEAMRLGGDGKDRADEEEPEE